MAQQHMVKAQVTAFTVANPAGWSSHVHASCLGIYFIHPTEHHIIFCRQNWLKAMLCSAWTGAQWLSNYCRAKVSELAKSGLILVDLRATIIGELYGDAVWRFSQLPRPARQAPSAAAQLPLQASTKGNQGRHENLGPARSHLFCLCCVVTCCGVLQQRPPQSTMDIGIVCAA